MHRGCACHEHEKPQRTAPAPGLRALTDSPGMVARVVELLRATVFARPQAEARPARRVDERGRTLPPPPIHPIMGGALALVRALCAANCHVVACADSQVGAAAPLTLN
jgi:hypothetical protein